MICSMGKQCYTFSRGGLCFRAMAGVFFRISQKPLQGITYKRKEVPYELCKTLFHLRAVIDCLLLHVGGRECQEN